MVVDENTTPDIRATAQNLFNLVIVGIGIIVGSLFATSVVAKYATAGGDMDYQKLFSVPMYALIQVRSLASHRSRIIAANNILNALFMVASALISAALLIAGVSLPALFLCLALGNLLMLAWLCLRVPEMPRRAWAWLRAERG